MSGFDGVEVWNSAWSAFGAPTTEAELDTWIAEKGGDENPWIRAAVRTSGVPQNGQALRFWQALLSDGWHVAPVGGGDRHAIFPAGLPNTYVAATRDGVLDGLAAGATFVSRGPQGPQVLLEAEVEGQRRPMGAEVPAGLVTVHGRAGRAAGGELRLVTGGPKQEPESVSFPLAEVDESGTFDWSATAGDWLHAVVVDPLPTDVPADRQAVADAFLVFPEHGGLGALAGGVRAAQRSRGARRPEQVRPGVLGRVERVLHAPRHRHGMYLAGRSWDPWIDRFRRAGFECLAPSWPGREGEPASLRASPDQVLCKLALADIVTQFAAEARRLPAPSILVGHSTGGLVVQLLLARGLGRLGVAIDSAPPQGVRSFAFSHLRANAPVLWPGDAGPIGPEAAVDFSAERPPLLMIAGEIDTIIPASLIRANAARYDARRAPTELVEMKGRTHYLCGQPGWEEVADQVQRWIGEKRP